LIDLALLPFRWLAAALPKEADEDRAAFIG